MSIGGLRDSVSRYLHKPVTAPSLKSLAWACKVLALVINVLLRVWILPPRWGADPKADVQIIGFAILSLLPNRWLVFSRIPFLLFLLLAMSPFRIFLSISALRNLDVASVIAMFISVFFLAPLPLSIVLSRVRYSRGDKFTYA